MTEFLGFSLNITDRAAVEMVNFIAGESTEKNRETAGIRVEVLPGGCSGFRYTMHLEDKSQQDDVIMYIKNVRVFLDEFSMQLLNGVTIDHTSSLTASGFTFNNPNASGGCGCGSSFSV